MKKQLLTFLTILIAGSVTAQLKMTCNPQYQDSTYGAWPDTTTNFDTAFVNTPYLQVLNFKAPSDAGDIDPTYSGATIQSYKVTDATGLPSGFTYTCSAANCQYNGGVAGCAELTGTATAAQIGTYNIVIKISATIMIGPFPTPIPREFTGYRLVIKDEEASTVLINPDEVYIYPNPASTVVTILNAHNFESAEIYGINGQMVASQEISKTDEEINVSALQSGVYFIHLKKGNTTSIHKFTKN
ncbi:MAG: T9SS type A sorting domain-containing protein [Crocinitomicaceae bacterium]